MIAFVLNWKSTKLFSLSFKVNFPSLFLIRLLCKDNNIRSISQRHTNKPQTCFSVARGPSSSFVRTRHSAALSQGLVYKGKASDPEGPDSSACLSSQDILDFVPWWGGRTEWKHLGSFIYESQVKSKAETLASSKTSIAGKKGLLCGPWRHACRQRPSRTLTEDRPRSPAALSARARCRLCIWVINEMWLRRWALELRLRPSASRPWSTLLF